MLATSGDRHLNNHLAVIVFPKGACTQIVYTSALNQSLDRYFVSKYHLGRWTLKVTKAGPRLSTPNPRASHVLEFRLMVAPKHQGSKGLNNEVLGFRIVVMQVRILESV